MLACVCRPVTGSLPKPPSSAMPHKRPTTAPIVVTREPRIATATIVKKKVPGRPTAAELRAMALRQQQQIDSQHQLLAAKEQRLRFLKAQEARGAAAAAEGERLRRLRERVEAQESKLRRLRALRGQVDLQKTYNVTLSNDLDSIRALFSEKEKELSLAVAKVEALTRQLEELRRDRRGPLNLIPGGNGGSNNGGSQQLSSPAARELEKLRRELMYRNQLSLQQDARLHLQREALQQRQAELRSVDQRILELQTRLQRKKASNLTLQQQHSQQGNNNPHQYQTQQQSQQQQQHVQSQQQQFHHQHYPQHQQLLNIQGQTQTLSQSQQSFVGNNQNFSTSSSGNSHFTPNSGSGNMQAPVATLTTTTTVANSNRPSSNVYPSQRILTRGNVAAVEPYIHTPQKSSISTASSLINNSGHLAKQSAATANTSQQNQLIQDLTNLKLNLSHVNANLNVNQAYGESDESKIARQKFYTKGKNLNSTSTTGANISAKENSNSSKQIDNSPENALRSEQKLLPFNTKKSKSSSAPNSSHIPKLPPSSTSSLSSSNECDSEKAGEVPTGNDTAVASRSTTASTAPSTQQLTVHSTPLSNVNKSVAIPVSTITVTTSTATTTTSRNQTEEKPAIRPKAVHQIPSGNLVVPPRKPISSVAPTSITSSIPKIVAHSPKVNMVAPNIVMSTIHTHEPQLSVDSVDKSRPALPPKPNKSSKTQTSTSNTSPTDIAQNSTMVSSAPTVVSLINKAPMSEPNESTSNCGSNTNANNASNTNFPPPNPDNLPIKAKPLTIRKQPLSEQPRLKSLSSGIKPMQYSSRRIEMPPAFLFPEIETMDLKDKSNNNSNNGQTSSGNSNNNNSNISNNNNTSTLTNGIIRSGIANSTQQSPSPNNNTSSSNADETDKSASSSTLNEEKSPDDVKRRVRHMSDNGKTKLTRRVSFDPLALLLDASLEGELELVKKTAMQVPNPSAANDEGITALHNAICAGHFEIVKFLVEFGCDVNAQDSDGWTPLHCAASCNNLAMVKFLVENGACLFAATLSDHETPAEKCEEDEEGFDGCSEYLYSIQEKLGILNNGEVYAVFSYDAQQPDELSFNVNDLLTILRKGDDAEREWWWAKNSADEEGYVPRNLLGLYPRVPLQNSGYSD